MAVGLAGAVRAPRRHGAPPVPETLAPRPRVLGVLSALSEATVICLKAPGGYGKTTALAQWVAYDSRRVIWLRVPPAAADPAWMAQSLLDSLAETGLIPAGTHLTGSSSLTSWHLNVLPALEAAVASVHEPVVVVVDDVGAIEGTAWECLVESVASSLPVGSQLAITTRGAVPATLWRLQNRGCVAVVEADVLAFDDAETSDALRRIGVRPSTDELQSLLEATEGWPAAVYLAGMSAQRESMEPSTQPPIAMASSSDLAGYLLKDAFGRLTPDDAAFLVQVSVLPVLDAAVCDEVAQTTGSLARLRRLAAANQLFAALDDEVERFRMHPLLADALGQQLREGDRDAWKAAHIRASHAAERRCDLDGAVHHAKTAGDDQRLAILTWSHAAQQLGSGRWAVMERWLAGLSEDRLRAKCGLALGAAWVASHSGNMARMSRLALAAAERSETEEPGFALDSALLEATIGIRGLADIEDAARRFVDRKPRDDPWQSLSHYLLGVALLLRDETHEGVAALVQGHRCASAHHLPLMEAHCLSGLADAAMADGDTRKALSFIRESRELVVRYRLETVATTAPVFTTSAVGHVLEGRFVDARAEAVRALRLTSLMRPVAPWHAVHARLALAQLNVTLGDPERAKLLLDEASDLRGPSTVSPRLDRMHAETAERLKAVSAGLAGASSLTTAEVRVLQYLPTHLSLPEIADELSVSRHTVKTQAVSAYRKLGVHTRTEAIGRARRAGLLPPA
ncbi:MAG: LuxR C-terminal-related transcriptional regulator [Jiangellales bacterium]